MKNRTSRIKKVQDIKTRRLEREFSWIGEEFQDIHTLSDVDLYNTERYAKLHLRIHFI